jgi:signal transduction histidine kinase
LGLADEFFALIVLRAALIAYSLLQIRYINRTRDYKAYDTSTLIYMIIVVVGILLVNLTRPTNFIPHIIVVDIAVLVVYLIIPIKFIYQAIPAWLFSIGEAVIIMFTFQDVMPVGLNTALVSVLFVNIVGALSSLETHSYRWQMYLMSKERKETDRLAAIGQTAGMIGHDIRNPLQAITSELYIARQSIAETPYKELAEPALESINIIEEQTDYISKIVSDLQDYARPLKPELKEVDMTKIIASIFQTVKVPDNIKLVIDMKGFPKIQTDPTLIRRALANLVNNAIQAMPEGGTLEITAYKNQKEAIFTVQDTGKGIPKEVRARLFTPLVTTKAKGQGLGLAVVKRIVEALGGIITFESELGRGTEFTIKLPLKD